MVVILRDVYKELDTHTPDKQLPVAGSIMACPIHEATFLIPGKPREARESLISLETGPRVEQPKQWWLGKCSLQ